MAIAVRSTSTVALGTRANTVVNAPAGFTTGDVVVIFLSIGGPSSVTPTAPGGFTANGATSYSAPDPWTVNISVWVKAYDAASSWTFTHASASSQAYAIAFTGVNTTTPIDVTASTAFQNWLSTSGAASSVAPSITIATAGARGLVFRGSWDGDAITPPAGWTEDIDTPVIWVGDRTWSATGATGTVSVPHGNGSAPDGHNPWGIIHGALRPAAGVGTNYIANPSDTLSIFDTENDQTIDFGVTSADSLPITDGATRLVTVVRSSNDPGGITDSVSPASSAGRTTADSAGATDSVTLGVEKGIADSAAASDSAAAVQVLGRTIADTAAASDAVILSRSITINDTAAGSDLVVSLQSLDRIISDTASATDSVIVELTGTGSVTLADQAGATDAVTVLAGLTRTAADNIGITDAVTVQLARAVTANDPASITDAVTLAVGKAISDTATITDQVTIELTSSGNVTAADIANATDSVQVVMTRQIVINDTASAKDAVNAALVPAEGYPIPGLLLIDIPQRSLTIDILGRSLSIDIPHRQLRIDKE